MSCYDEEYYCPNCDAVLNDQIGFDPDDGVWTCTECGKELYGDEIAETMRRYEGAVWHCDWCNAVLNKQYGFDDYCSSWRCTECGHINEISDDNVCESEDDCHRSRHEYSCPNCGGTLNDQPDFYGEELYTCTQCGKELFKDDEDYEICFRCPHCDAILNEQSFFNQDDEWTCEECGTDIYLEYADEYSVCKRGDDVDDEESDKHSRGNAQVRNPPKVTLLDEQYTDCLKEVIVLKEKPHKVRLHSLCVVFALLIAMALAGCVVYHEFNNLLAVGFDSSQLVGKPYATVEDQLREAGFKYIKENNVEDLKITEIDNEQLVTSVRIGSNTDFTIRSIYRRNTPVEITYHSLKKLPVPMSAKEAKGKPYGDTVNSFEAAGFTNIELVPQYDVILGWITSENDIASISVGESNSFSAGETYRPDVKITITYHALKSDKPE